MCGLVRKDVNCKNSFSKAIRRRLSIQVSRRGSNSSPPSLRPSRGQSTRGSSARQEFLIAVSSSLAGGQIHRRSVDKIGRPNNKGCESFRNLPSGASQYSGQSSTALVNKEIAGAQAVQEHYHETITTFCNSTTKHTRLRALTATLTNHESAQSARSVCGSKGLPACQRFVTKAILTFVRSGTIFPPTQGTEAESHEPAMPAPSPNPALTLA